MNTHSKCKIVYITGPYKEISGNEAINGRVQPQNCFPQWNKKVQSHTIQSHYNQYRTRVSSCSKLIIRHAFSYPTNQHVGQCGYIFIFCPQLPSIITSVEVLLLSSLCTSATILRSSSVMMHAISKMCSLTTSSPAGDSVHSQIMTSTIIVAYWNETRTDCEYWCTHLSSMVPQTTQYPGVHMYKERYTTFTNDTHK